MKRKKRAHVTRASIANVDPPELAEYLTDHCAIFKGLTLDATLFAHTGVFKGDIETGTTIETTADWGTFAWFLLTLLEDLGEDSAYIVEDGEKAFLLHHTGELEDL